MRSTRAKKLTQKSRLNEQWNNLDSWDKLTSSVINEDYYEKLIAVSQEFYCRQISIQKMTENDCYDHDFDSETDFTELIHLTKAYIANSALNEKSMTIKQALAESYKTQYKKTLDDEMKAHKKNKTYKRMRLFNLFSETKILISKVIFRVKRDLQSAIRKFKARWCVKDFEQQFDVNFNETYASIVKTMSYKALFAFVAHENLNCEQMNVITTFLNSMLKEKIYIWPPKSFEKNDWVWLLLRALYDLKQSFRDWYQTVSEFLISQEFERLKSNHSIFINKTTRLVILVYVDDLLIIESKKSQEIAKLKKALDRRFEMTNLNLCSHYLGMTITRDRANRTLHLSQKAYIDKMLLRFGMKNCKKATTSMNVGIKLNNDDEYQTTVKEIKQFQAQIECLIYLFTQTRPDIAFAVQKLDRFNLNPTKTAENAVKQMLRYLQDTKDLDITYEEENDLIGYTDANWAEDTVTRKSTGAYLFTLYEDAFSWSSKLQTCVALSSCESEYMTQTQTSKKAIWISRLLKKLDLSYGLPAQPITVKANNQDAIALSADPKFHSRIKHIDVQWHFVREMVEKGKMRLEYCPTDEMAANGLTKPLNKIKFGRFIEQVELTIKA